MLPVSLDCPFRLSLRYFLMCINNLQNEVERITYPLINQCIIRNVNQHICNSNDVNTSQDIGIRSLIFDSCNNSFDVISIYINLKID